MREGDTLARVKLEDAAEDVVELVGDWEDSLEEVGVAAVSCKGGVVQGSLLPWVTAAGEVDKDDTKSPYVIGCGGIAGEWFW